MAKINKKANKKTNSKSNKKQSKFNLKECVVRLEKIDHLVKKEHTKTFDVEIRNGTLKVDNRFHSNEISEGVFQLEIKIKQTKILIVPCEEIVNPIIPPSKISKPFPRSLNQLISDAWSNCLREKKHAKMTLTESQFVMAKMKGYSPWPGKISSFTKNGKSTKVEMNFAHNFQSFFYSDLP